MQTMSILIQKDSNAYFKSIFVNIFQYGLGERNSKEW